VSELDRIGFCASKFSHQFLPNTEIMPFGIGDKKGDTEALEAKKDNKIDKSLSIRPDGAPANGADSATDEDTGHRRTAYDEAKAMQSIHGDTAAKRRAVAELLFFASVGDLKRCQRIIRIWNLDVSHNSVCDYDKRTPLHLAASEGAFKVTEWLLKEGADVNALDRFKRTPLQDSVLGDFKEVAKLLLDNGGKVHQDGQLVGFDKSKLAAACGYASPGAFEFDPEWEIDPNALTIMEKLGEGEFGVVHKARWYGSFVAVKILKGSSDIALGDFRSEIEILQKVHHPNAVQFLGACTTREPYILVTELMTGGSLADAFRRPEAFPMRRGLEIALDAARGLAYMHNRNPNPIIHRDLKPGNLMLSGSQYQSQHDVVFDQGIVKLADFGLSKTLPWNKHADMQSLDAKFRLTGETGSYRYMAPEVFRHEPYNNRVDVYSFSMIAYQLFEHLPPFAGIDPVEAARQAALFDRRPEFLLLQGTGVKEELRGLIEKCWSPDPGSRPSFDKIIILLEKLMGAIPRAKITGGNDGCCTIA